VCMCLYLSLSLCRCLRLWLCLCLCLCLCLWWFSCSRSASTTKMSLFSGRYMCIYTYTRTNIHACMHCIYIRTYVHAYIHTNVLLCLVWLVGPPFSTTSTSSCSPTSFRYNRAADHRLLAGATVARFSNRFKELIQDPALMLVSLRWNPYSTCRPATRHDYFLVITM